jgi:hypothetical protein
MTSAPSISRRLPVVLVVVAGALLGLASGYLYREMKSPPARAGQSTASPFGREDAMGAHGAFGDAVAAYRSKAFHSVEEHQALLRTLDLWLAEDPLACANALEEMGALDLLPPGAIAASFIDAYDGNAGAQMRKAKELKSAILRDEVVTAVFQTACNRDPMGSLDLVASLPPYQWRLQEDLGHALGKVMDPGKIKAAMIHPAMNHNIMTELMRKWVETNTGAALAFLGSASDGEFLRFGLRKNYYYDKIEGVGDPDAQLAFFDRLPPSMAKVSGRNQALGSMLAKSPGRWEELTRDLSPNAASGIAASAAKKAVTNSLDVAAGFLLRIPGEKARAEATRQATDALLFSGKPRDATAMVAWAKSIPDPVISRKIFEEMRFQGVPVPADVK